MATPTAALPRVTLLTTQTIDGKIALSGDRVLLEPDEGTAWRALRPDGTTEWFAGRTDGSSIIDGAGTFVRRDAALPDWRSLAADRDEPAGAAWSSLESWMPDGLAARVATWFVIVDGQGRVPWDFIGDEGCHLLVLTTATPGAEHLAFLRRMQIPYLVTSGDHVDLIAALGALRHDLGVEHVFGNCGGDLGAVLMRLDVVDGIDIAVLPAVIGGETTPTMVDGAAPLPAPAEFRLVTVEARGDLVHLIYRRPDTDASG